MDSPLDDEEEEDYDDDEGVPLLRLFCVLLATAAMLD